jgi:hypothetical protein
MTNEKDENIFEHIINNEEIKAKQPQPKYKINEFIWINCYPIYQSMIGYGEIKKCFITDEGFAYDIYDEINGGIRTGLEKDIIEKPTGRMVGSYAKSKQNNADVQKKKNKS